MNNTHTKTQNHSPWVVMVTYGETSDKLIAQLRKLSPTVETKKIIVVDTKSNTINNIANNKNLNALFEFSGYEAGFNYALEKDTGSWLDCIFLNDTIFKSHSHTHIKIYLKYLSKINIHTTSIAGMVFDFSGIKYIPSYLFRIKARRATLFDNPDFFTRKIYLKVNTTQYEKLIKKWLSPDNFLTGWYKALPWKPLDDHTYARKKTAIQLEHSLVERFNAIAGGDVIDIKSKYKTIKITAFLDKIFTNQLKIRYRLGYLFRKTT